MEVCENCSPGYGSLDCPNGNCPGKTTPILPKAVPEHIGLLCIELSKAVSEFNSQCMTGDNSHIRLAYHNMMVAALAFDSFIISISSIATASGMETR